MFHSAHLSPKPKRQIDRFSRFCTAHSSLRTLQWETLSPKLALLMGNLDPHLIHDALGECYPTIRHHGCCSCFRTGDRKVSVYFTMCRTFAPSKLPLPMRDLDPQYNMFSWAHPSPQPKQRLDRFSHFCCVTDRPTDQATRSVTIDRIYVGSTGDAV